MIGAVQLGMLAACIVMFVPMGMAGWHLSRNKMLFFSGALFITLAVGVHLTPYFPYFTTFLSSTLSSSSNSPNAAAVVLPSSLINRESCISLLHEIEYRVQGLSGSSQRKSWNWVEDRKDVVECEFQKLRKSDALDLLNGAWVVIAGDSQARLVVVSMLELVLGVDEMERVRGDLFKRHSDYKTLVDENGMKLDFIWAPLVSNLTDLLAELKENRSYPDVLVMGAGLWDMLHFTNVTDYYSNLKTLKDLVVFSLPVSPEVVTDDASVSGSRLIRSPHLFWLGMPKLINSILNTEEKREKMTDVMFNAYEAELSRSKLLRQSGGPLLLLDVHSLGKKCGVHCTVDGMHYDGVVYEAALHVLLNALLIESHQKLR